VLTDVSLRTTQSEGYSAERICPLLGLDSLGPGLLPVWDISKPSLAVSVEAQLVAWERSYQAAQWPLTTLLRFFLMRAPVPAHRLKAVLGPEAWAAVVRLGLAYVVSSSVQGHPGEEAPVVIIRATVQLTPVAGCEGLVLATDFSDGSAQDGFEPVMYVGVDSLGLAAAAPRTKVSAPAGRPVVH
jgi:hypothetical protein